MVTYISRAAIGLRKPKAAYSMVPSQVKNTAFHYPGMASPINATGDAGLARVKSALRGWQAYHMDSRGWSDIAYCIAIDQAGRAYTLRGLNIRSAANGGAQVNLEYSAVLLVLGNNEEPSAAMAATARAVMQDYRVRYSRIPRRPTWHGAIRPGGTASDPSTSCPGTRTIAQIKAGKFDASSTPTQPPTTPPKDWFDMATEAQLEALIRKVVAEELNKQDVDLWIKGTGKSQVIDPIKRIEAALAANAEKVATAVWWRASGLKDADGKDIPLFVVLRALADDEARVIAKMSELEGDAEPPAPVPNP